MNPETCELLLRGGIVIDGTGAPRRAVDGAVDGDRISAVGRLDGTRAAHEIDARCGRRGLPPRRPVPLPAGSCAAGPIEQIYD